MIIRSIPSFSTLRFHSLLEYCSVRMRASDGFSLANRLMAVPVNYAGYLVKAVVPFSLEA